MRNRSQYTLYIFFFVRLLASLLLIKKPNVVGFFKNLFFKINSQEGQLIFIDPENKSDLVRSNSARRYINHNKPFLQFQRHKDNRDKD